MTAPEATANATLPPPLTGIKVLDFSRIIAGPLCTQQLADMGADVIKVENPDEGDDTRRMTTPNAGGEGHFFLAFNRSKQSLALDPRTEDGKAILLALLEDTDVLVENYRPGVMKKFGLDYESLAERFPKLIYHSVSAYGQTGPMWDRPGFDPVLQAESGMMSLTGEVDGPPMRHALSLVDTMTGLQSVAAICAALLARGQSGRGQRIDLALMDMAVASLGNAGLYYLCSGGQPPRAGNSHMTSTPTNLFDTADGPIYMALGTNRLYRQLCKDVLERPDLIDDPRFLEPTDRLENRPVLFKILEEIFATRPRQDWMKRMRHLPAGPVRMIGEALESEEVAARGMVADIDHPTAGPIRVIGSPLNFSASKLRPYEPPPTLGQHSAEILRSRLGYDDAKIVSLRDKGVIGTE
ncbi:MAG: CaiB/BaiF CoA transferase family protein [Alphaproteobacteria bacterium]